MNDKASIIKVNHPMCPISIIVSLIQHFPIKVIIMRTPMKEKMSLLIWVPMLPPGSCWNSAVWWYLVLSTKRSSAKTIYQTVYLSPTCPYSFQLTRLYPSIPFLAHAHKKTLLLLAVVIPNVSVYWNSSRIYCCCIPYLSVCIIVYSKAHNTKLVLQCHCPGWLSSSTAAIAIMT